MQLLDVKNDLARIIYLPQENPLMIADFLLVEDENQSLLAQVIGIESSQNENSNYAVIKFIISIDKNAKMAGYNGYSPAKNAKIITIDPKEISLLFKNADNTVYFGNLINSNNTGISINLKILKNNFYAQIDNFKNSVIFNQNITTELARHNKQIVIIDFDNRFKNLNATRISISDNFKLPLNVEAFDYLIKNDLKEASNENKAVLQSALMEIQSYVKTLKEGFLPFQQLMNVVDMQYKENPNSDIAIFRNKMLKYAQDSLFAQSASQFNFINNHISQGLPLIIDLSLLQENWHKFAFELIIKLIKQKCYLISSLNDINSDNLTIDKIYGCNKFYPILSSTYNYKFARELKYKAKNLALFLPLEVINDFPCYSSFLNKLTPEEYILWGQNTNYIPLILNLVSINDIISDKVSKEIKQDVDDLIITGIKDKSIETKTQEVLENKNNFEIVENEDSTQEEIKPIDDKENLPQIQHENEKVDDLDFSELTDEDLDFVDEVNSSDKMDEINIYETALQDENIEDMNFEKTEEEDNSDLVEPVEDIFKNEDMGTQEISKTEIIPEIEDIQDVFSEENRVIPQDIMSDLISPQELTEENGPELPVATEPIVIPISPMEKQETIQIKSTGNNLNSQDLGFKEGQYVEHQKYGKGLIEKVITYGNKKLCSIQFENVGRRLLDPELSGIKSL